MQSKKIRFLLLFPLLLASMAFSLSFHSTTTAFNHLIFFDLRLPRVEAALLAGGSLALAGCLMQLLLDNPLADPYILGLSGGASVGALLSVWCFGTLTASFAGAWLGCLMSLIVLLFLAKPHRAHTQTVLLLGVALSSGFAALTSVLTLYLPQENAHSLLYWLAGDLSGAHPTVISSMVLAFVLILTCYLAPGFNVLSRGNLEAQILGLPLAAYRLCLFFLSALLTASAISLVGCIGFIGLIIPHVSRRWLGNDHRLLLPGTVLLGGSFLIITDALTRLLFHPVQLPIGLCMTLIGIPYLLRALAR